MPGNPVCSPSLTFRVRLESAGWLQRAEASAASDCRFCNKLLLLCFCATPGAFPEARQVGRNGRLCRECCWVSLRSRTARLLGMLLPSLSCQEQNQGRFCDTFFYFMLFSNGYPRAGENSFLVFRFCAKIPQILAKLPNFLSFAAVSGLHHPPKSVE